VIPPDTDDVIRRALDEDLGGTGDLTSMATIPADAVSEARIVARAPGRLAGVDVAARVFELVDPDLAIRTVVTDGSQVGAGAVLIELAGSTHSILAGERVALNLLGHLSGVATATSHFVAAVAGSGAAISDTRKTTPGLRALEKRAVVAGGGTNHRFGLYDAVLIKDNHIAAVGSIADAVKRARANVGHTVTVEVEAETLDQVAEAVAAGADVVMLDNMDLTEMRASVALIGERAVVEASGGITSETIEAVASTGVDVISVGAITHSAPALDVALEL
jgi:nicotinate-nucleotide pyrophosphorylase (carboxylating)